MQLLTGGQRSGDNHAPVHADRLTRARSLDRLRDHGEGEVPAPGPVLCDPVGLRVRHRARPTEPDPSEFGNPDLAPVPVQPPDILPGGVDHAEPLILVSFTAARQPVRARIEVPHRLIEVPQRLLLNHHRPGREPCALRAGFGKHPGLLHIPRHRPDGPTFLVDVFDTIPADLANRFAIGLQLPELVQIPGQVPHLPGMRAVLHQDCFLRGGGVQPVSGHRRLVFLIGFWIAAGGRLGLVFSALPD
jgi:hypothetical protein